MSFDYDKIKKNVEEGGSQWSSYADLFMVLSIVFLLLYVTSSIRTGTFGIQKHIEYQRLAHEAADLREQIKVYNTLKDDYLENETSQKDQEVYSELMDKLTLLQEEAKEEKEDLRAQAAENEKKERALNKYQQIVRNIINTNVLAQTRIQKRDKIITKKKVEIAEKDQTIKDKLKVIENQNSEIEAKQADLARKERIIKKKQAKLKKQEEEITKLEQNVKKKRQQIYRNKKKIKNMNNDLAKKISQLKRSQKKYKMSKKTLNRKIAKLKKDTAKKVSWLKKKTQKVSKQLKSTSSKLNQASKTLSQANKRIEQQQKEKAKLDRELASATKNLQQTRAKYESQISDLKSSYAQEVEKQKEQFEKNLAQSELNAKERAQKLKEFEKKMAQSKKVYQKELKELSSKIGQSQNKLKKLEIEKTKLASNLKSEKTKAKGLSKSLKKAQAKINASKKLAKMIAKNFKKAGVSAQVDPGTGDVTLSFGKEYFDTGSDQLKPNMESALRKFVPIYSKSLFDDPKIAKQIKSVEIVGFASPTFGGRYVNPNSLKKEDQKALAYNLKLSQKRANSIFSYMFNTKKVKYEHQKNLLPLIKVTGRGFLSEGASRDIASGMSRKQYCAKFDCKKSQRVIVKFNLKD